MLFLRGGQQARQTGFRVESQFGADIGHRIDERLVHAWFVVVSGNREIFFRQLAQCIDQMVGRHHHPTAVEQDGILDEATLNRVDERQLQIAPVGIYPQLIGPRCAQVGHIRGTIMDAEIVGGFGWIRNDGQQTLSGQLLVDIDSD